MQFGFVIDTVLRNETPLLIAPGSRLSLVLFVHIFAGLFEAEGVEALEGICLEVVIEFDAEFMVGKFAAEGIVTTHCANDVFKSCGLIIHQCGVGLYGGETGQFLLVTLVMGSQSQGVMPHGVGDGGNHSILCHHYA